MTRAALVLLACVVGGCTPLVPARGTQGGPVVVDPCAGSDLSLGEAAIHCRDDEDREDPPSPEDVEVLIRTRELPSGADGVIEVVFRNQSGRSIGVSFPGTLHFDTSIWRGDQRVDERWEVSTIVGGLAGCAQGADCRDVHVDLEPGGSLVASLEVSTRVVVIRDAAGAQRSGEVHRLERADGGPIPPGEYEVRVTLPWMDLVEGSATQARVARSVRGPLTITR